MRIFQSAYTFDRKTHIPNKIPSFPLGLFLPSHACPMRRTRLSTRGTRLQADLTRSHYEMWTTNVFWKKTTRALKISWVGRGSAWEIIKRSKFSIFLKVSTTLKDVKNESRLCLPTVLKNVNYIFQTKLVFLKNSKFRFPGDFENKRYKNSFLRKFGWSVDKTLGQSSELALLGMNPNCFCGEATCK